MTKKTERLFDKELLTKSKEERKEFFDNYTISHPKMELILKELKKEIDTGVCNVILVVGPSGVGKSRLFMQAIKSVYHEMAEQIELDKSIIPISGIELPNPDLGKFNWKDFYYRVLSGLNEPLIEYKIDVQNYTKGKLGKKANPVSAQTAPELRRSIENAFYFRKTKAFLIDEAQHFFKIGTGQAIAKQFNSIKSLANMANTKIVLFGTYDLNSVINLDGQLSRRVKEINFSRYDYGNKKDVKMFQSVLYTFQKMLPVLEEPNLIQFHEYIYENCVGCVGILKNWLQRCLIDALDNEESTVTLENLERHALQTQKLLTLAEEAINGELDFVEKEEDRDRLKSLMGTKGEEKSKTKRKANAAPGMRKPVRDDVG
jgi:energy-coupling factor transporter ATP-binding protein EcfA2